jgi:hypothetical protein
MSADYVLMSADYVQIPHAAPTHGHASLVTVRRWTSQPASSSLSYPVVGRAQDSSPRMMSLRWHVAAARSASGASANIKYRDTR